MTTIAGNRPPTQLEDSLVANVLLRNAHRLDGWTGTPTELLGRAHSRSEQERCFLVPLAEIARAADQ